MSKLEYLISICLGFTVYIVVFIRLGFLLSYPVSNLTLGIAFITYLLLLGIFFAIAKTSREGRVNRYVALTMFVLFTVYFAVTSVALSHTFDTSWDGQGYHQSAIIGLSEGWNPIWESEIALNQRLPSQIFAEGYPSALWEIHASIYSITDSINSAKVMNVVSAFIALLCVYSLLRKISLGRLLSSILSILVVIQPVFAIQMLTFMADGFGYQILVIAVATLVLVMLSSRDYWAIAVFIMAELFLVSTKYSNLPVALVLGIIFASVIINRFLNKEYTFTIQTKMFILVVSIVSIIFAYLPYGRNAVFHGALFYPTNIPELSGSVRYNNVPSNLQDKSKIELLFYGLFSRTQSSESGDPRHKTNVAHLKVPFTFTQSELDDTVALYNNRVGAGGPFFSGALVLSVILLAFTSFQKKNRKQRYALYVSYFSVGLMLVLSLLTPAPNLLRYVYQLQLLPFVVTIPLFVYFKNISVKVISGLILLVIVINTVIYSHAVVQRAQSEMTQMNNEFERMRTSGHYYQVRAQHFYSSYILLKEQSVPFVVVDKIRCQDIHELVASSTTTQYCIR